MDAAALFAALRRSGGRLVSARQRPFGVGFLVRVDMPTAAAAREAAGLVRAAGFRLGGNQGLEVRQVVFTVPESVAKRLALGSAPRHLDP